MKSSIFKKIIALYDVIIKLMNDKEFRLLLQSLSDVFKKIKDILKEVWKSCKEEFDKDTLNKFWKLLRKIFSKK
jgi:formyltetrahydrofolate synthetase